MLNSPFPLLSELPEVDTLETGDPKALALYRLAHDEGFRHGETAGHREGFALGLSDGREAGFRQGLAEGRMAGAAEAEAQAEAHVSETLAVLHRVIEAFKQREAVAYSEIESGLVDLALSLATTILDREIEAAVDPGADAIARALKLAPGRGELIVRMNPADCETLGDTTMVAPGRDLVVVADPAIERGGTLIETDSAVVDARLSTALARARDVLYTPAHLQDWAS